ncbi:MAG: penicillin-binding protein 2 [Alphaproteobacteria bacterium]|nr:MAG: penicillin-binding protein 2 [Alphaproteobacteria bacterium]
MKAERERSRRFTRRALLLAGAQGALTTLLAGRLYYLAVVEGERYRTRAEANRIALRLLAPPRGEIVDRQGRPIATNRRDYRLFLIPEQAGDLAATLVKLKRVLPISPGEERRLIARIRRSRPDRPVTVAQNLPWDRFAAANVAAPDLPGIIPDAGLTRWYPDGALNAHAVGYVGPPAPDEMDGDPLLGVPGFRIGKRGIEKTYDKVLRGRAGGLRVEVNAYGRVIRELDRREGTPGAEVKLSLDLDLQRAAVRRLGEESGAIALVDLKDDSLCVYVSSPGFDPNAFNLGISRENWQAMLKDPRRPLIDKCAAGLYPPGSTIKPVVALAALHYGVTSPEEKIVCTGDYPYGDNVWHCWKKHGHGPVSMIDGIARSCDVYFYELAQRLGIERLARFLTLFGLGRRHVLGVGNEQAGLVPTPAWSRAVRGLPWHGGETLNVGIGQGALMASPLQLAVMSAMLATGRRNMSPRIVAAVDGVPLESAGDPLATEEEAGVDIDADHWRVVRSGMEHVLRSGGTAHHARLPRKLGRMAGKTGTAQVRRITDADRAEDRAQSDRPWQERHHAWFIGYAPVSRPRYAISVLVEHGGGGSHAAAPVARDLMIEALQRESRAVADEGSVSSAGGREGR